MQLLKKTCLLLECLFLSKNTIIIGCISLFLNLLRRMVLCDHVVVYREFLSLFSFLNSRRICDNHELCRHDVQTITNLGTCFR